MKAKPIVLFLSILSLVATAAPAANADPLLLYASDAQHAGRYDLFWTNNSGRTSPTQVSAPLAAGSSVLEFDFVPHRDQIVYRADSPTPGAAELYTAGIFPHSEPRKLNGPLAPGGNVQHYLFSPDGARLAYIADQETDGQNELYLATLDSAQPASKINAPLIANGEVVSADFSPDGTRLAYTADQDADGVFNLYATATPGAGGVIQINSPLGPNQDVSAFKFSPDSQHLAMLVKSQQAGSTETQIRYQLYTRAADASDTITLVAPQTAGASVVNFAYEPGGTRLAWLVDDQTDGEFNLFLGSPNGGGVPTQINAPLSPGGSVTTFQFSDDGRWIAFRERPAAGDREVLYIYPTDGSTPAQQLSAPIDEDVFNFAFSPDGNWVLYMTEPDPNGRQSLFARPASLAQPAHAVNAPLPAGGSVRAYTVGSHNRTLYYLADADPAGHWRVYRAPLDGSADPVQILPSLPVDSQVSGIVASSVANAAASPAWLSKGL